MHYLGVDVHKSFCFVNILNEKEETIFEGRVQNDKTSFASFLTGLPKGNKTAVVEAGYGWMPVVDYLESFKVTVCLADAKKVKSFAKAKNKTDKRDAKLLAWLLLKQELPTAYLPTKKEREAKELTRHRTVLIKQRTMIKNQYTHY